MAKEYIVLNEFKTYVKDKLVSYERGQIVPEKVASLWPNLPQMLGYLLQERHGAGGET